MENRIYEQLGFLVADFKLHMGDSIDFYTSSWEGLSTTTIKLFKDFLQSLNCKLLVHNPQTNIVDLTVSKMEIPDEKVQEFYKKAKIKMNNLKEETKMGDNTASLDVLNTLKIMYQQKLREWPDIDIHTVFWIYKAESITPALLNSFDEWLSKEYNKTVTYNPSTRVLTIKPKQIKKEVKAEATGNLRDTLLELYFSKKVEQIYQESVEELKKTAMSGETKMILEYSILKVATYCEEKFKKEGLVTRLQSTNATNPTYKLYVQW